MITVLKSRIVRMGNSRGIRIPKLLIEQLGLGTDVQVEVQKDHLIIRPAQQVRHGWDEQFQKMAEQGDDQLLDVVGIATTTWDQTEWEW